MSQKIVPPNAHRNDKVFNALAALKVDCLLLNSIANVSYAAGFYAPDAYLIAGKNKFFLITDSRYAADFKRRAKPPLEVVEYKGSIFKAIAATFKRVNFKTAGFESRHLSFAEYEALKKQSKTTKFIPLKETLEPVREIKEEREIANIRQGLAITQKAYFHIQQLLKPGIRELDIAAELERFIRLNGATKSAFDIIVASGPNSSYPHAGITERKLKESDPVVIDMGVVYNGYKCDLTRTFFLGRIKPIVQKAFRAVSEAQKKAIETVCAGVTLKDIDTAARDHIAHKGFGKFFSHALGHGVGLEIHELPSLNRKNHNIIKQGMVFTVEPGIYIADCFGIRIEDMVLVTDKGAEVLSGNDRH